MPTSLLVGATGLTGQHLLPLLASSPQYEAVHLLLRRPMEPLSAKVHTHQVDFTQLDQWKSLASVDHVYCTLGTTQKIAGSREGFYAVDHDLVVAVGRLAQRLGASCFTFMSSLGADPRSWTSYYLRVKGETERDVAALALPRSMALRPALLKGPRQEHRPAEVWGERFFALIDPLLIGQLRRYRPVHVQTVAQAMLGLTSQEGPSGFHVVNSEELSGWVTEDSP